MLTTPEIIQEVSPALSPSLLFRKGLVVIAAESNYELHLKLFARII